jgi:hypothetical protein
MLDLQKGIQVISDPGSPGQILLSSGTVPITNKTYGGLPFGNSNFDDGIAFLPRSPWRIPTKEEFELLLVSATEIAGGKSLAPGAWVRVFKVPDSVLAPIRELGISSVSDPGHHQQIMEHEGYPAALMQIARYSALWARSVAGLQVLGTVFKPAGLTTVSFDADNHCYVGLHLDNWDRLPVERRHEARERININLGSQVRSLLFINLSLTQMATLCGLSGPALTDYMRIGSTFMRQYPTYPVVRLNIRPGEAYLAPTENILHDGCTLDMPTQDVSLQILGHFNVLPRTRT